MSKITAIEAQKKNKKRCSIFVDGEFVAGVFEDVILSMGLFVGMEISKENLEKILEAETYSKALNKALRFISYRDRTVAEIIQKLSQDSVPEEVIERVIEKLQEKGFINDEKFSVEYVNARTVSRPMGKRRLALELQRKGVNKEIIEQTVSNIGSEDEYETAKALAIKRLNKTDINAPQTRDRIAGFLQRRGFEWETISKVLAEILKEAD